MLQTLRDNTKGVVAGILIGLLVIIFALSGAEALFTGGGTDASVASVNSDDITEQEVARQVNMQRQQILSRYGESVPDEYVSDERLRPAAIDNLIQRRVLVQEAQSGGMAVSDATVNSAIVSNQQFHNAEGQFDPERYQQLLRSAGFSPASYKKALREEMLLQQLTASIADSGFVTPTELEQLVSMSHQTRDFDYITLTREAVSENVNVTDDQVQNYYQNNQGAFTQEEQVAVDYIELSIEGLMEDIEISEQELRSQYEQNQAAQEENETQRRVAHILIEDQDPGVIQEVEKKLESGEEFAAVAREYSDDTGTRNQGGDLGYVQSGTLPEPFEKAMNQLAIGEVSEPVQTEAGTHIIKLLDERGSEPESFEDQRKEIAQQLKRAQAEGEFVRLMTRLEELSYNAQNLSEVEDVLELPVKNTGLFGRSGGEGIAGNSQVIEAAFSEEVFERNNASNLLELSDSRVVVVKKTDHQEAYVKPLEEVEQTIVARLEEQEIRSRLLEQGQQAERAVTEGESMKSQAADWEVELQQANEASRDTTEVPRDVADHVFSLPKPTSAEPTVVSGVLSENGYTLVALRDVQAGSMEDLTEEERQALAENLSRMQGEQDYSAYQALLQQRADVDR